MIKFINEEREVFEFDSHVDHNLSPIKEILNKGNYYSYSLVLDESNTIPLKDVFQLQVNVEKVGTLNVLFPLKDMNRKEIIKDIIALKEIEIIDEESATNKLNGLIKIINRYKPLFGLYKELPNTFISLEKIQDLIGDSFILLTLEPYQEEVVEEKAEPKKETTGLKKAVSTLYHNKFHLLLIIVSTLLLQISLPLTILNVYSNNLLFIFLIICCFVALAMNGYSYYDYFTKRSFKNLLFYFSVVANMIGIGAGIGIFTIFYNISTKAEGTPSLGQLTLIGALVSLGLCAISIVVTKFIPKKIRNEN